MKQHRYAHDQPEPFKRCDTCGERKHPYLFPYADRTTGERSSTCLGCVSESGMRRMEEIRQRARSKVDRRC